MMSKSCREHKKIIWSETIRETEYILNNTVHTTTKETPSMLLFGATQRGHIVDTSAEHLEEKTDVIDRNFEKIREQASQNILNSQENNFNRFLKNNPPAETYEKGDYVVIKHTNTSPGVNKKLDPKYRGPYVVHKILPHDRYVIRESDYANPV